MSLLGLPEEILLLIFEQLNLFSILQCGNVCSVLRRLHFATLLLFEAALSHYGRKPTLQGSTIKPLDSVSLSSHLYFLHNRERNWRTLTSYCTVTQSLLAFVDGEDMSTRRRMWAFKDSVVALGQRFPVHQRGWGLHTLFASNRTDSWRPLPAVSVRRSWLIDYVIDPAQDLNVVIHYTPEKTWAEALSLSTSNRHPLSEVNELTHGLMGGTANLGNNPYLQVSGDILALQAYTSHEFYEGHRVYVFNWKTGFRQVIEWVSQSRVDTYQVVLLSPTRLIICLEADDSEQLSFILFVQSPVSQLFARRAEYLLPKFKEPNTQMTWYAWCTPAPAPVPSYDLDSWRSEHSPPAVPPHHPDPASSVLVIRFRYREETSVIGVFSLDVFLSPEHEHNEREGGYGPLLPSDSRRPVPDDPYSSDVPPPLAFTPPTPIIPWSEWGPANSRFLHRGQRIHTRRGITRTCFGSRLVTLAFEGAEKETDQAVRIPPDGRIRLFDFCRATVAWAREDCVQSPETDGQTEEERVPRSNKRRVVLEPSILEADILFEEAVESRLAYYEVTSEERTSTSEVRIDDDWIIFIDEANKGRWSMWAF